MALGTKFKVLPQAARLFPEVRPKESLGSSLLTCIGPSLLFFLTMSFQSPQDTLYTLYLLAFQREMFLSFIEHIFIECPLKQPMEWRAVATTMSHKKLPLSISGCQQHLFSLLAELQIGLESSSSELRIGFGSFSQVLILGFSKQKQELCTDALLLAGRSSSKNSSRAMQACLSPLVTPTTRSLTQASHKVTLEVSEVGKNIHF